MASSERPYVFTKASLLEGLDRRVVHSLKRDSILREAHDSLRRLGVDAIDLYQIHWPIPTAERRAGRSPRSRRVVGHGAIVERCERRASGELLPFAEREGTGVIVYSPMGSGLLTGKMTRERIEQLPEDDWRKRDLRFNEPQLSGHLDLVERLTAIADRHDTTPGAVAVAWTLRNPAVDGAIIGFRRPEQVDPIIGAANLELSDEDLSQIEGGAR